MALAANSFTTAPTLPLSRKTSVSYSERSWLILRLLTTKPIPIAKKGIDALAHSPPLRVDESLVKECDGRWPLPLSRWTQGHSVAQEWSHRAAGLYNSCTRTCGLLILKRPLLDSAILQSGLANLRAENLSWQGTQASRRLCHETSSPTPRCEIIPGKERRHSS